MHTALRAAAVLSIVAILVPIQARAADSAIPSSAVPAFVRSDFDVQFSRNGQTIIGRQKSACFRGHEFRGLSGWYRRDVALTDADRRRGIESRTLYYVKARFERFGKGPWREAKASSTADSDMPYEEAMQISGVHTVIYDAHKCGR